MAVVEEIRASLKKRGALSSGVNALINEMVTTARDSAASSANKKTKRRITGYNLFVREHRAIVGKERPELTSQEITGVVSRLWSQQEQDVRDDFIRRARDI